MISIKKNKIKDLIKISGNLLMLDEITSYKIGKKIFDRLNLKIFKV